MNLIDYRAQAEEFAKWLVNGDAKGRRKFFNREVVRGTCPRQGHDDTHPSFSFHITRDAWACSCGNGKASELQAELGWKPAAGPVNGLAYSRPAPFSPPPNRPPDGTYKYANGNRKLKWRVPGQKSVIVWKHESGKSGMVGEPGVYRLVEALKEEGPIHVSESESDVDALWDLGCAAIATHAGAGAPWKELPKELAGRQLVVWEHQDEPGRKYAAAIVEAAKKGGADAAIAKPKEPNKDVRDWIVGGANADEISAVARAALMDFQLAETADALLEADLAPPEYVISPVVIRANITLIQGEPKAGKSILTLYMAACAAIGIWKADRWSVPRSFRVLYMTWEDGRRRVQKRLKQFLIGLGEPFKPIKSIPNLFFYTKSKGKFKAPRIRLEDPAGRVLLKKLILAHRAEFLVLDTLSHLTGVDENQKKDMQPVMDALTDVCEETDCAIAFNHHTGKESKGARKSTTYRSRGTSVIPAAADVILDLGDRGKSNTTPTRYISREDDPDSFLLEYLPEGDDLVRFKLVEEPDENEDDKAEKYAKQKQVIEALAKIVYTQPAGAKQMDVARETKLPRATVQRILGRLAEEQIIQRQRLNDSDPWLYAPTTHAFPPAGGGAHS